MNGQDAMLAFVVADPEVVRAKVVDAIESADRFSPDVRAQLAEWATDTTTLNLMLVAFASFAAGFITGYDAAEDDA